jgi:hypothetical protein
MYIIYNIHYLDLLAKSMGDILYYSNYCPHSVKVIQFITKKNLIEKLNCICVDRRVRDQNNNQMYIVLENGKRVILPPNVHSVPCILQVKNNYTVVEGEDIIKYLDTQTQYDNPQEKSDVLQQNGEPAGFVMSGLTLNSNILSEQYTPYDMTPDELAARGKSNKRELYNYVSATHDTKYIATPEDKYRPNKLSNSITVDSLQQTRNEDMNMPSPHIPMSGI